MLKFEAMWETEQEWLKGRATLGAATKWTNEEIRLTSELAYGLAEQGRTAEAIVLFEGLAVLAPATVYFQAALGALWLREDNPQRALKYLNDVVRAEPRDLVALVNRGEAFLRLGDRESARKDLQNALSTSNRQGKQEAAAEQSIEAKCLIRARALLLTLETHKIGERKTPDRHELPAATE